MIKKLIQYYCYIMANQRNGTLYIGITSNLERRVYEHKQGISHFTNKYQIHSLVWFEVHQDGTQAIQREKQLKRWKRAWKINLIQSQNPNWDDLYPVLINVTSSDGCLPSQA